MVRVLKISALVSAVVLLNAVTTLLFVQSRVPATAQVGPAPCVDGDVNGDAGLNIGDPIYLLQHLFQGGPGPVACAQGPTPSELESVLAKFRPRLTDLFAIEVAAGTAPGGLESVLVVPANKIAIVTQYRLNGGTLRLNGQDLDPFSSALAQIRAQNQSGTTLPQSEYAILGPGDHVELYTTSLASVILYGYWVDTP